MVFQDLVVVFDKLSVLRIRPRHIPLIVQFFHYVHQVFLLFHFYHFRRAPIIFHLVVLTDKFCSQSLVICQFFTHVFLCFFHIVKSVPYTVDVISTFVHIGLKFFVVDHPCDFFLLLLFVFSKFKY